ncbi:hypothetical protein D3C86_1113060 [compost metagenome]
MAEPNPSLSRLSPFQSAFGRQVNTIRETLLEARQVALEVVRGQHRHTGSFLDDLFQCVQLLVVDLFPRFAAFQIGCTIRDLQKFHRLGRSAQRFDLLAALQLHEEFLLHQLVHRLRCRRQLDHDLVDDRLFQCEPVGRVDRDAHVFKRCLDLALRLVGRLYAEPSMRSAKPTLLEGVEGSAESVALINEPHLPPQIL